MLTAHHAGIGQRESSQQSAVKENPISIVFLLTPISCLLSPFLQGEILDIKLFVEITVYEKCTVV